MFEDFAWTHDSVKGFVNGRRWLGIRCSTVAELAERIPSATAVFHPEPADLHFIHCSPREAIDLSAIPFEECEFCGESATWNAFTAHVRCGCCTEGDEPLCNNKIEFVVVAGETGPDARPMSPAWVRSIRDHCVAAGVPFFFAGWGEWCPITDLQLGYDRLYKSRRKAEDGEDQAAIDELYGRRCIVETSDIGWDGSLPGGYRVVNGQPSYMVFRVGADKSGRMLDGREWLQLPEEVTE